MNVLLTPGLANRRAVRTHVAASGTLARMRRAGGARLTRCALRLPIAPDQWIMIEESAWTSQQAMCGNCMAAMRGERGPLIRA